ncbi:hypothetical protein IDVR_02870 [Intrasporangium sp. DVR]
MQLPQCGCVEGARLDAVDPEGPESRAHLPRCAGREGHGEDPLRLLDAGVDRIGDAVRDGPGLAGACTGQDTQRPGRRGGDLALLGIEPVENVVRMR